MPRSAASRRWLLLIAGLGVMLIALCYADLASRFDTSGGPQLYAGAAFGRFVGFQAGWMLYAARAAALAANAHVLAAYAGALWPPLERAADDHRHHQRDHAGQCRRHPPRGRHAGRHDHAQAGAAAADRRARPAACPAPDPHAAGIFGGRRRCAGRALRLCRVRGGDHPGRRNARSQARHPAARCCSPWRA